VFVICNLPSYFLFLDLLDTGLTCTRDGTTHNKQSYIKFDFLHHDVWNYVLVLQMAAGHFPYESVCSSYFLSLKSVEYGGIGFMGWQLSSWLGCPSLAGGLSLPCVWSVVDSPLWVSQPVQLSLSSLLVDKCIVVIHVLTYIMVLETF